MLLLGHLDVVNARREDWTRDPYKFIEEDGYFYGRGTSDMKAMVAVWVDTLIRLKQQGWCRSAPSRWRSPAARNPGARMNGAQWLAENKSDWIAAEFALNEGGGRTDGRGKVVTQSIQVGEKSNRTFEVETTNPGGHSSTPIDDNAIYELADAIAKVRAYNFPIRFNDTTRAYFAKEGAARNDDIGRAMAALAKNSRGPRGGGDGLGRPQLQFHAAHHLRGDDAGGRPCRKRPAAARQGDGQLPRRARRGCRHHPRRADRGDRRPEGEGHPGRPPPPGVAVPPPLDPKIMAPAEKLVARYYPGAPLIPVMMTGATDATYVAPIGIPTSWRAGRLGRPGRQWHARPERAARGALGLCRRDFLFDLVKALMRPGGMREPRGLPRARWYSPPVATVESDCASAVAGVGNVGRDNSTFCGNIVHAELVQRCAAPPSRNRHPGLVCFRSGRIDPQLLPPEAAASPIAPSTKSANARALALASLPVGNTAHRSIGGRVQSGSTRCTAPLASSGPNIQSDATASPISASTAARIPSAALTRNRPRTATDTSSAPCRKTQLSLSWL